MSVRSIYKGQRAVVCGVREGSVCECGRVTLVCVCTWEVAGEGLM